ncbi:ESX-1 secretion-associated protein [Actinoplanes sp. RD1]|uniref:ESX-1 secretion-associated protein n=1 Tax=Actinoplanes sp. RD1 TaxID=3064538 RepID=UPI00274222BF|nr:ESX-1 secretion-associated protein [Actinoplanes sp. RD1]
MELPSDAVLGHARSVDRIADDVQQARAAVREVSMGTQAYGQLCQFLPALLSPLFSLAAGSLHDTEDALRETSLKLRAVARETTQTDDAAAAHTITSTYG